MSVKSKICGALLGVIVSMYSFNSYAQETIHVGTEPTFAPFGFVDDKTSEIVGFDIDVINAIGKAADLNVVVESDPYYVAGQDLMVRKDSVGKYKDMKALEGKGVCVQLGSVGAIVAEGIKDAKVKNFNTVTEAYMELKKHGCEAVITGTPVNQFYLVQTGDKELVHVPESVVRAADLGIVTNKKNTALMEKINAGLKKIKEDGTYDKIYNKWFK